MPKSLALAAVLVAATIAVVAWRGLARVEIKGSVAVPPVAARDAVATRAAAPPSAPAGEDRPAASLPPVGVATAADRPGPVGVGSAPKAAGASTGAAVVRFDSAVDVAPAAAAPAVVTVELARTALRLVGKDRGAEAIWKRAINDPGLPAEVRSDLIEDLNDEGYTDPDQLQEADLPLVLARLRLIEKLRPYAMDEVNAAAFEEAYMDLLEMLVRLRSGG